MQYLADLKDEIIILKITIDRDNNLTNTFFGEITGRVRVIPSSFGDNPTTWVGQFAFEHGTKVEYDDLDDFYTVRVSVAAEREAEEV